MSNSSHGRHSSRSGAAATLESLGRQLRDLPQQSPPPSDQEARIRINAICAQGLSLYQELARKGVPGFNAALPSKWIAVCHDLARTYPGQVPIDPGAPVYEGQATITSGVHPHHQVYRRYPYNRWRQRAEEYAQVMELLAATAVGDSPIKAESSSPMSKAELVKRIEAGIRDELAAFPTVSKRGGGTLGRDSVMPYDWTRIGNFPLSSTLGPDIAQLCGWVRSNIPTLDTTPLENLYRQIVRYHNGDTSTGVEARSLGNEALMMLGIVAHMADGQPAPAPAPADDPTAYIPASQRLTTDWHDVQLRLSGLQHEGEAYIGCRKLGKRLGVSTSTINKAIRDHPSLQQWAKRKRSPRATTLNAVVADNVRQSVEPDPADVLPTSEVDDVMAMLIQEAKPNERAKLNAMGPDERRKLAVAYRSQEKDSEPSPLTDGLRKVKAHKQV